MPDSIDDLVYGDNERDPEDVKQGNPGKPQSDYETPDPIPDSQAARDELSGKGQDDSTN